MARRKKWDINKNIVYIYTNKINQKKYCGMTCRGLRTRSGFEGKNYLVSNPNSNFSKAIIEYGWENFEVSIISENLTRLEAENKEIETIRELDLQNEKYGYNMVKGGNNVPEGSVSAKHGKENGMYGNGNKLRGAKNGRAKKVELFLANGEIHNFDTQKECFQFLGIGKEMFMSFRDNGDKPFKFQPSTNKSIVEKYSILIGSHVKVG